MINKLRLTQKNISIDEGTNFEVFFLEKNRKNNQKKKKKIQKIVGKKFSEKLAFGFYAICKQKKH